MKRYTDAKWKRKRSVILKRDNYMCRECKRYGKVTGATTVHHILPVEERSELYLVNDNLLSLCSGCHNQMHDRFTNELTIKGNEWKKRTESKIKK